MRDSCDCRADGYCPRYRRYMGGRLREVCAGVNVDLGTAAAFREQWRREADLPGARNAVEAGGGVAPPGGPTPLLLRADQAAGDAVAMTAAIYSLHRAHPGRYLTAVESRYPEVFEHNPDVTPALAPKSVMSEVQMHYPAIHQSNERGIHFMQGWCEFLGAALSVDIPLLTNRPHLYFDRPLPDNLPAHLRGNYWVVCSGGKCDFTNKLWGHLNYLQVVTQLAKRVRFIQVGISTDDHPRLISINVVDMVGKTTLRGLFDLVRRARGVLCGVSLLMHVAAALEKPAVVLAGGREPVAWNAYPRQQYLHTVGALPCSDAKGRVGGACWRSRVVPLGDGTVLDRDTCLRPVDGVPECMTLISPTEVATVIRRINST